MLHNLNSVSETALITLKSHVVETNKQNPVIADKVAIDCFNRLQTLLPGDVCERVLNRKLPSTLTRHIALRARKYDSYARSFLEEHSDGLVVSLGCGFDTRYWRVSREAWKYIEIDLPGVIEVKKKVLGDIAAYTMLGCSVLEESWINYLVALQKEHILFLAEGLFMYLPKDGVISLFKRLSASFVKSQIVFEVVNEKYTKGLFKKMVASKLSKLGTEGGTSFTCGVRDALEVESYGDNIKVVEEWSYFEDGQIEPGILHLFRHFKPLSRTQWTVKATIG